MLELRDDLALVDTIADIGAQAPDAAGDPRAKPDFGPNLRLDRTKGDDGSGEGSRGDRDDFTGVVAIEAVPARSQTSAATTTMPAATTGSVHQDLTPLFSGSLYSDRHSRPKGRPNRFSDRLVDGVGTLSASRAAHRRTNGPARPPTSSRAA